MRRFIVLIVGFGLLASGVVSADPGPAPPSLTGVVTGGIFREANDLYLSTTEFSLLETDVLFLQFDMPSTAATGGFQLGGSTRVFGLYLAALYDALIEGTTGRLGANQTQTVTYDDVYSVDGTGLITGKTTTRRVNVLYDADSVNNLDLLVGLGTMGIGLRLNQSASNSYGNFQPAGSFPGSANWTNLGVSATNAQATTVSTYDASLDPVAVSSQAYGLGEARDQALDMTARFGMPLSLGGVDLAVGANLLVGFRDNSEAAQQETFSQVIGSATSITYTPAKGLNDSEPQEIGYLTAYSFREAAEIDRHTQIQPSLFAEARLPLNEAVTAHAGLGYQLGLPLFGAKFLDTDGATELRIAGTADTFSSTTVATAVNADDPNLTQTTTTVVNAWQSETRSQLSNTVDARVGVTVQPSDRFRFGVMYQPMLVLESTNSGYAGSSVETRMIENGDGVSGVGDEVRVRTVTRGGFRETARSLVFTNTVNTAAQFFLIPEKLRVNLGAEVSNVLVNATVRETITDGLIEYETRVATDTTDPDDGDFVVTDYSFNTEVRVAGAAGDHWQTAAAAGSSTVRYQGGLTFFFDKNMFLDLRMVGAGGSIWDTTVWSLEMTILY